MRKYASQQREPLRENAIHVGAGFVAKERWYVVEALSALGPHLESGTLVTSSWRCPFRTAAARSSASPCAPRCPACHRWWRSPRTRTSLAPYRK